MGRHEALVCYRTAEEAKTVLPDINMYQGWTAELYRSTSKDEQNRVNEGYREEQNKAIERRQQKERENTNTSEDKISSSTKEETENLKKDLKYIKETLKTITSQQWLANKEEANDNTKEIKKQEKKELKGNSNTQSNKQKETEIEEKGQLPITRNENRKRKDINENRENTKNKINKRIEQSNEITKKKTRRSKKIKNALTNFKVFYQNIRGLKSKVDSIMKAISDYQPILICLVETHLQKEKEIRIQGYSQIFRNNRSGNSRSIKLAVKQNIKTVTLELAQEKEIGQILGILLDNNRSKITIGVRYASQENTASQTMSLK